jgi:hypothetical protein
MKLVIAAISLTMISSSYAIEEFSDCAANCIKYVYKCYGVECPELMVSTNPSSIKDIVNHLTNNKFQVTPFHAEIGDLENINSKYIYIVHLDGIHFTILENINGKFTLIDWPNPPLIINKKDFISRWDGFCIKVSRDSLDRVMPKLSLSKNYINLGTLNVSESVDVKIPVQNISLIKSLTTSCGCLAKTNNFSKIHFKGKMNEGKVSERVIIESTDPLFKIVEIKIIADIVTKGLFSPEIIVCGNITQGEVNEKWLHLSKLGKELISETNSVSVKRVENAEGIVAKIYKNDNSLLVTIESIPGISFSSGLPFKANIVISQNSKLNVVIPIVGVRK